MNGTSSSVKGRRCTLVSPVTARDGESGSDSSRAGDAASHPSALLQTYSIAAECGQTLAQMALAWVLRSVRVTSVIIGASGVSQIEENVKALEHAEFSAEELAPIDQIVG